jgi:CDP-diglyceride synthetase
MTRVLSASVLIALVVATIWYLPSWATVALAVVASALAAREVAMLAAPVPGALPAVFVAPAAGAVTATVALRHGVGVPDDALIAVLLAAIVVAGTLVVVTTGSSPARPGTLTGAAVMLMGPIYVGLPLGALAWMHVRFNPGVVTWLLAVIDE